MDNQEPQLHQLAEDATHFKEALRLLAVAHKIYVVEPSTGWGVSAKDDTIHTEFDTFGEAFKFVMGLLEVKG